MLIFAYLCVGELLPLPILRRGEVRILLDWQKQQVILLSFLSCLPVLLGRVGRHSDYFSVESYSNASLSWFFAAMNTVPVIAAVVTTNWFPMSSSCSPPPGNNCHYSSILFDTVGLVTARLARLNLGLCLLFATRGESAWLFEMTGGLLGFTEAIPIHRTAGWWCAGQSVLHSVAYVLFYIQEAGLRTLWRNCFPVPSLGKLNRLGLVNMFGLLACFSCLGLVLSAIPFVRRPRYHIFQRLHLPVAMMFVLCCALHDLSILLFGIPGLADWYLGWRGNLTRRRLPCKARLLSGTSGPWVELTVDYGEIITSAARNSLPPRGEWVSIKLIPLGREFHPLSVASICMKWSTSEDGCKKARYRAELSMFISSKAGDWSAALAALVNRETSLQLEIDINGPFPSGGSDWILPGLDLSDVPSIVSSRDHGTPALLLLAGGIGITGWLPALEAVRNGNIPIRQQTHLVWCVKTEADYLALSDRLPLSLCAAENQEPNAGNGNDRHGAFRISVYVTSHATRMLADTASNSSGTADHSAVVPSGSDVTNMNMNPSFCFSVQGSDNLRGKICVADTSPIISLLAAVAGLVTQHYVWWGLVVKEHLTGSPQTIFGYAVVLRVLPVALIIGVMTAAVALGRRVFIFTASAVRAVEEISSDSSDLELEDLPLLRRETTSMEAGLIGGCYRETAKEHDLYTHDVLFGRPDFDSLVNEEVTRLSSLQDASTHNTRRYSISTLNVVTCGPKSMMIAVRDGCETARKISSQRMRIKLSEVYRSA